MNTFVTQEFKRLRKQAGALLKDERIRQGLTRQNICESLNLKNYNTLKTVERGHFIHLHLLINLAKIYGCSLNIHLDYQDENLRYNFRKQQSLNTLQEFSTYLGHQLKVLRQHHHYSQEYLAKLSNISVAEINSIEEGTAPFNLKKICLLISFLNRGMIAELTPLE